MRRSPLSLLVTASLMLPAVAQAKPPKEQVPKATQILKQGTKSGDFAARAMAVEGLGHADKKEALPLVREALKDQQWQVRRGAIRALIELRDKKSWEQAIAQAMRAPNLNAFTEVMPLIEPLGVRNGVKLMMKQLKDQKFDRPERYVKAAARMPAEWMNEIFEHGIKLKTLAGAAFVEELPKLRLPDAAPLYAKVLHKQPVASQKIVLDRVIEDTSIEDLGFLKKLLKSKDADVKFKLALALAKRGDASGKEILKEAVEKGDAERKLKALVALKDIASDDIKPLLKPITSDEDADIKLLRAALEIHAALRNPKLGPWLDRRLMGTNLDRRAASVAVLGQVKGKAALPQLHKLLTDGAVIMREGAARAIGDLAAAESIEPLQRALFNESSPKVKIQIIRALGRIRTPEVVGVLRSELTAPQRAVRAEVVKALAAVRHDSAIDDLKLVLRDRDPELRRQALIAIMALGPKRHMAHFRSALTQIDAATLAELAATHKAEFLPHLELALASGREDVRQAALAALLELDPKSRATLYRKLATDSRYKDLRLAAFEALIELEGVKAADTIKKLATDEDKVLRVRALWAMGERDVKGTEAILVKALDDMEEQARVAAAASLLKL